MTSKQRIIMTLNNIETYIKKVETIVMGHHNGVVYQRDHSDYTATSDHRW